VKPVLRTCVSLFLLLAAVWIFYDPLVTSWEVQALSSAGHDALSAEQALLRRGRGAVWALRNGTQARDIPLRIRSARLLALLGDDAYDAQILEALRDPRDTHYAALAEYLILSVWDQRNGPLPTAVAVALRDERARREEWNGAPQALDLLLIQHPAWSSGYVLRARRKLKDREVRGALDDAKVALHWEPEHFEAYTLLGECYQLLDFAAAARQCYEKAIEVNPRLEAVYREKLERARKDAAAERERRLLERLRDLPVL